MEEWINLISNVGFPIAITIYILMRLEKTLKHNTNAIIELSTIIKERKRK